MTTRAKELFDASVDQVRRGQLRPALGTLLDALAADPAHAESLMAAGRICRMLGAPEEAALFEALHSDPQDVSALYNLGYRLVDQTRPDVAAALFERGLAHGATDGTLELALRRELAYARFAQRDFEACLRTLAALERHAPDACSETELLDQALLSAEAALYLGRREVCRQFLERAEAGLPDDGQRVRLDALHGLLGRSVHWPALVDAPLRAWHFIQHAGVLLKTAGGYFEDGSRAGRFDVLELRPDMLAFLLRRLAQLIERLEIEVAAVAPTGPVAAPLASGLARWLGAEPLADLTGRAGRPTLLVAANAGELQPLSAGLVQHRADLHVFALNLDWSRDNAVMPDVAGVLARRSFLPWESRYVMNPDRSGMRDVPGDGRPADTIGAELHELGGTLHDDGGKARADFERFYLPLAGELVLGNEDRHPYRREFTQLSPCWTPVGRDAVRDGDDGGPGEDGAGR